MTPQKLIENARKIVGQFTLSHNDFTAGKVAAALLTSKGNIYTGINIELACGIGFCAEHSAVAEMLKHRETHIEMIVAVNETSIIPPCGRCRELLFQIDHKNMNTKIYLSDTHYMTLSQLLPHPWVPNTP
ncbi:MAG: cytidine deaminase [Sulfurovum sp.]|nr:cytidine deaminase [Sulfurovum sp.]MDD3603142.1 cytidine deaminase [Sulfurovum sp.]